MAARNQRFVQDASHNGQAADNGVVSDGLGLLSIPPPPCSSPSRYITLYAPPSLSITLPPPHPRRPFSLFLSVYTRHGVLLAPSRSFYPSAHQPSFSSTPSLPVSLCFSLSLPLSGRVSPIPRPFPRPPQLAASLSGPRGSVKCKRPGPKPTKRSLAPALTEHLPPSATLPSGSTSAKRYRNDLSTSRVSRASNRSGNHRRRCSSPFCPATPRRQDFRGSGNKLSTRRRFRT